MDEPVAAERPAEATEPEEAETPEKRSPLGLALKLLALAVVAALFVLLGWATLSPSRGKSLVSKIRAGEKPAAPRFELPVIWSRTDSWPQELRPALRDGKLSLEELRGWPVVVNFWASWCIPCREEAPLLTATSRAHRGRVVFLGIDMQDLRGDALAFLREFDTPYVSVYDRGDKTNRAYGTTGVPETYYLDARGRIVAHTPGQVSWRTLEQGISAIARTAS